VDSQGAGVMRGVLLSFLCGAFLLDTHFRMATFQSAAPLAFGCPSSARKEGLN
jgi:hypothetical protein